MFGFNAFFNYKHIHNETIRYTWPDDNKDILTFVFILTYFYICRKSFCCQFDYSFAKENTF